MSVGLSSLCFSSSTLPCQLRLCTAAAGTAPAEGTAGAGHEELDPQAGAWVETPLDFPVAGVQGVKKLVGF